MTHSVLARCYRKSAGADTARDHLRAAIEIRGSMRNPTPIDLYNLACDLTQAADLAGRVSETSGMVASGRLKARAVEALRHAIGRDRPGEVAAWYTGNPARVSPAVARPKAASTRGEDTWPGGASRVEILHPSDWPHPEWTPGPRRWTRSHNSFGMGGSTLLTSWSPRPFQVASPFP